MAWTKESFDNWKSRSGDFFQFLTDRRNEMMAEWGNGEVMEPHEQSMTQIYGDMISLNYEETIEPFYEKDDDDEK